MVGSFDASESGTLMFNVDAGAPPAGLRDITIDETASVTPKTGEVTVSGTVTCAGEDTVFIDGMVRQRKGRVFIEGFFFTEVECSAGTTPWSATVEFSNGLFTSGRADVTVFASSESDDVFVEDSATVKLLGKE